MSTTSSTQAVSGLFPTVDTESTSATTQTQYLNQDDFLTLLIAQMSAQDPMNPMSNEDFMAQMAQFSNLEQTKAVNENLKSVLSNQSVTQASGLLGRTVQVQSSDGVLASGVVTAITSEAGTPLITVNGQVYSLSDVLAVSLAQTTE